jgi:hypothetical protein
MKKQRKELQNQAGRQEHRIRNDYQKQAARAESQFIKAENICQRLAIKAVKSKLDRQQRQNSVSPFVAFHISFSYN